MREYIKILTTKEGQYYDWFLTLTLEALIIFLIHIDSLYCTALLFPIVIYSMLLAQQPATLQHYNQQQYIKRNWEIHNKRFRNSYKQWFWNQPNNKGCTIILYSYINLEYWQGRLWWLYNGWINTTSFTQSQSLHSCSCVLGELISLGLLSVSWEEDNWEPGSLFLKSYGDILGDNDVCTTSCGLCPQWCTMLSSYRYVICINIDVNMLISQWIDINSTSGAPNTTVL